MEEVETDERDTIETRTTVSIGHCDESQSTLSECHRDYMARYVEHLSSFLHSSKSMYPLPHIRL
jgi:hypothetical protein